MEPPETLERRRIALFCAVTFGVSWATALVVFLTGGLANSPQLLPGIPLWLVLVSTFYMFGPAIGAVVTRFVTDEGFGNAGLGPNLRDSVRAYLAAWFAPAGLVLVGAGLFYAVFPAYFDPSLGALRESLAGLGVEADPLTLLGGQFVAALTFGTAINTVFAFGEEFGWRAYLLPKLWPLGSRRAVLLHGVVWGVWHWPILAMGYNYGVGYPGFPWTGMLAFLVFAVGAGGFLAWVTTESGSVWPASVGHGAINAIAGIGTAFAAGSPPVLLGPAPVGVVAALPWVAVAFAVLFVPGALRWAQTTRSSPS